MRALVEPGQTVEHRPVITVLEAMKIGTTSHTPVVRALAMRRGDAAGGAGCGNQADPSQVENAEPARKSDGVRATDCRAKAIG